MKIKKWNVLFALIFTLLAANKDAMTVEAADTKGPVLHYVNIHFYMDVDNVAGEEMDISFNVEDANGVSDVWMIYKKVNDEGFMRLKATSVTGNTDYEVNEFRCDMHIDKYAENGRFRPYMIFVYDNSSNKNVTKYKYNVSSQRFEEMNNKKQYANINEPYIEIKQNNKFKFTEFKSDSFEKDWNSVKKGKTIVIKGSKDNSKAKTVLSPDFLKYAKKNNVRIIIPDPFGMSEMVIQGEKLTSSQTKKNLEVYLKRGDLVFKKFGANNDEMYHEEEVNISNTKVPFVLRITPDDNYLEIKGSYSTRFSKITKNSDGKITKTSTILKKMKFYSDDTIRKNFADGLGTSKATFAISSKNTAHDFEEKIVEKASFTKRGKKKLTCSKCGEVSYLYIGKVNTPKLSRTYYIYSGDKRTPTVTVTNEDERVLKKDKDYTVTYESGRTKMGRYTVTVKLKGDKYTGSQKVYFDIGLEVPENLEAKLYSYNGVELTWDKVAGADGYTVYFYDPEKDPDYAYEYIGATKNNTYKVKNLPAYRYFFVVRAYVQDGDEKVESGKSWYDSVTTIGKVKNLKVRSSGNDKVLISWDEVEMIDKYQISCSEDEENTNIIATIDRNDLSYKHTPEKNVKMYYKVRAYYIQDGKKIYTPWTEVKVYTLE